ncbi:hypothetical protein OIV83_003018 [Microbotryomycetes sp. JL201]|nr:hypothetical protein OIV83_003018 [Microbotryomycetes sp. JL201]
MSLRVQPSQQLGTFAIAAVSTIAIASVVGRYAILWHSLRRSGSDSDGSRNVTVDEPHTRKQAKLVSQSSVSYRVKISPDFCDEYGRVVSGALMKDIDVAAGIVAAKHAGGPCVTVSVDRVIFLQEIKVGDVVHLSSAVNRAWGSSMEIGVRVMRETPSSPLGVQTYCCHAYLTFVARHIPPPVPSWLSSLCQSLRLSSPPKPKRFQLPEVEPRSLIETKRFLLAGRRRARRIQRAQKADELLSSMRTQVFELEKDVIERDRNAGVKDTQDNIAQLQLELIVEAYMRQDPDIRLDGDDVVVSIEGFMEPVRAPLAAVEKATKSRGSGAYRRLSLPSNEAMEKATGKRWDDGGRDVAGKHSDSQTPLDLSDTLVLGMWVVRPQPKAQKSLTKKVRGVAFQHANSKSILFGGCLIAWIGSICAISARRIFPSASWSTAAIDSFTFKSAVLPGEVVHIRACVVKVWDSSVEVFAIATAEDRNSPTPTTRLVSESFFTLVAIDSQSGRPLKGVLRHVNVPDGPAKEVALGSEQRREERLQDKRILQRVYA